MKSLLQLVLKIAGKNGGREQHITSHFDSVQHAMGFSATKRISEGGNVAFSTYNFT